MLAYSSSPLQRPEEDTSPDVGDEDNEEAVSKVNPRRYKVFVR